MNKLLVKTIDFIWEMPLEGILKVTGIFICKTSSKKDFLFNYHIEIFRLVSKILLSVFVRLESVLALLDRWPKRAGNMIFGERLKVPVLAVLPVSPTTHYPPLIVAVFIVRKCSLHLAA